MRVIDFFLIVLSCLPTYGYILIPVAFDDSAHEWKALMFLSPNEPNFNKWQFFRVQFDSDISAYSSQAINVSEEVTLGNVKDMFVNKEIKLGIVNFIPAHNIVVHKDYSYLFNKLAWVPLDTVLKGDRFDGWALSYFDKSFFSLFYFDINKKLTAIRNEQNLLMNRFNTYLGALHDAIAA